MDQILNAIKQRSKSNPIKNIELRKGTNLSERQIKKLIESFRQQGYPILASREKPFGYFWASSVLEIEEFERTFLNQARTTFKTFRAMKKNYATFSGQQRLI